MSESRGLRRIPWPAMVLALVCAVLVLPATVRPVQAVGGGFIEGRVTDASGGPVTMFVVAFPIGSNTVAAVTHSRGDGQDVRGGFRLGPLPAGQYQLLVRQDLFAGNWAWQWYGGHTERDASPPITVTEDATVSGVDLTAQPGGELHGRVAAGDGHPIGCCPRAFDGMWVEPKLYVEVSVRSVELDRDVGRATAALVGPVADMAVTGDEYLWVSDAKYRVGGLQTGSYRIQVRPKTAGYAPTWFDGAATEEAARPVTATVAAVTVPPVVTFHPERPRLWPVERPTWDGSPRVGRRLRITSPGAWQKRPDSYRYSWRFLDERWYGRTLRIRPSMEGHAFTACVTARRDGYVKGVACRYLPQIKRAR